MENQENPGKFRFLMFTIPGLAVPGNAAYRHRAVVRKRSNPIEKPRAFVQGYRSERAEEYTERVRSIATGYAKQQAWEPLTAAAVVVKAYNQRADIDGLCKVMLDALNGIAYTDDRVIKDLRVMKLRDNNSPRLEVVVSQPDWYQLL